jgi:RNA polymerase sigma factor (sigma-70 family)
MPKVPLRPPPDDPGFPEVQVIPSKSVPRREAVASPFFFEDVYEDEDHEGRPVHPELVTRDVLDIVEARQRDAAVAAAVQSLPGRLPWVVELMYWDGATQAEIAKILRVTPGRVSQMVKEAETALRAELAWLYH